MLSLEIVIERLLVAMAIGFLLGIEREHRDKSAGLRTLTLICMGSCLFMIVSLAIHGGTPDRLASNIVTGIGFIGAGVIFKSERGVNGITTAATIWATAAIGMAVGNGMFLESVVAGLMVLLVLEFFIKLEGLIARIDKERVYVVVFRYEPGVIDHYQSIMKGFGLKFVLEKRSKTDELLQCTWRVLGSGPNQEKLVNALLADPEIRHFEV